MISNGLFSAYFANQIGNTILLIIRAKNMKFITLSARQQQIQLSYQRMDLNEQKWEKRTNFRQQIRRKQIQQHFSDQRRKLAEQQIIQQQQSIMKQLDSAEKKRLFLEKKKNELTKTSYSSWSPILRQLSISIRAFSEEGDFSEWIETGIVSMLTSLLKQEYKQYQHSKIAACILHDIVYYNKHVDNLHKMLQYEFIGDLVELCADQTTSAEYYYQLIATMISQYQFMRDHFINNGLVQVLTTRLKNYQNCDSQQVFCALCLAYRLIRVYEINGVQSLPKGNVIAIFIPVFDDYLAKVKNQQSFKIVLRSFASLVSTRKQHVLTNLFICQNLTDISLKLLTVSGDPSNRAKAANILAGILSSQKKSITEQLLRRGILDCMLVCSKMQNNQTQCITSMLIILSNITANSLEQARKVVDHQIFPAFLIPHSLCLTNMKYHENAIFILVSLVQYNCLQLTELLLRKYQLLQIFVQSLCHEVQSVSNTLEILRALTHMIRMYDEIYTGSANRIIVDLERNYNIIKVLSSLEDRLNNRKLHNYIHALIDLINNGS